MMFSSTVSVFADELPEEEAKETEAVEKVEEKKEPEPKEEPKAEAPAPEPEKEPEPEAPAQEPEKAAEPEAPAQQAPEKKTEKSGKAEDKGLKLNAGLSNGTYKPDSFTFEGGTGKTKVTCEKVIVKDGKYTAVFTPSSDYMTHFYMGTVSSDAEDPSLYDPSTGSCGKDVYKVNSKTAYVPVELDAKKPFAGRTTAMSEPHWVQYYYTLVLSDNAEKISDDTTIPDDEGSDDPVDPVDPDDGKDDEKEPDKKDTKTLKDGTYKVNATTCRVMFYLYPKEKNPAKVILVKKNGKMTATITLTGDGYDYVYMGTPKQAKKAGKKNWIKAKKVKGYYTFKIPVSRLDKKLPITPHSKKYEEDGDPKTDPWRPDKWIMFYSKGARKVKDGTTIETKGKAKSRNSGSSSKSNKTYKDESNKGTSAVNNSTGLKDGTYKPDRFSWSGGSGRLAYIRCNKIIVKNGKAYAQIEFSSSKYDKLRANGTTYSKSGGGNSKFTIPVKLNANNHIVGRTTAMSQPHWVGYSIFIYKKGAGAGKGSGNGEVTSTKKLTNKAPELMGLEFKEEIKVKYAKYFKIYKYEKDVILIEVDQAKDTALYKEEKEGGEAEEGAQENEIEYDEDGKPIAKSQNEITEELYQNNIVNYLIAPEGVEIPAGLDKECIIIQQPVDKTLVVSEKVLDLMKELGLYDSIAALGLDEEKIKDEELKKAVEDEKIVMAGDLDKPDYAALVKIKADLALFPSEALPEEVDKESSEEDVKESEEAEKRLGILQKRFSALGVPMIADRSEDEKTNYAAAEWIKVYGAIYGQSDKAEAVFDEFVKKNDKKKL